MSVVFDQMDTLVDVNEPAPIWSIDYKSPKELLDAVNKDWEFKKRNSEGRLRIYRENVALFKGLHFRDIAATERNDASRAGTNNRDIKTPKIVVNKVFELIETKVAKRTRLKPAIQVLPANDEWKDIINAMTVKEVLDAKATEFGVDENMTLAERMSQVFGDCYWKTGWNQSLGDEVPAAKLIISKGEQIPVTNSAGQIQFNEDGSVKYMSAAPKIGEIEHDILSPDYVYPQIGKRKKFAELDHYTSIEWVRVEELKFDYPDLADQIKETTEDGFYDYDLMSERRLTGYSLVKTFVHRPTKYFPTGMICRYTKDVILQAIEYPYSDGKFDLDKYSDIDIPNETNGKSSIQNIKQLQRNYNHLFSMQARNAAILAHPKYAYKKGTISVEALANDITGLPYTGDKAPEILNHATTNPENYLQLDRIEKQMERMTLQSGTSFNEVPPGMEAGVALNFLDEKENERDSVGVQKRYQFIVAVYKRMLARMGQFYKPEDGRMLRILGEGNEYMVRAFSKANFNDVYDVVIQNASSLPDTKAGKIQSIVTLNAALMPDKMFSKPEIATMLMLGNDKAFNNGVSVSVKSSEYENSLMLNGEPCPEPKEWEDLITHYLSHLRVLQSSTFRLAPQEIVEQFKEHLMATEMLMWSRAKLNPTFGMKLNEIDCFPIFFALTPEEVAMKVQMSMMPMEPKGQPSQPNMDNLIKQSQAGVK